MYYVAVDGGGTKTATIVCDASGRCLGRSIIGGTNPHFVGMDKALANVEEGVRTAMEGLEQHPIVRIALCIPGIEQHAQKLSGVLGLEAARITVAADTMSTFYGALAGQPGVVVLAGTGSFALGVSPGGAPLWAGGWGPVIGDDGSGHQMAVRALRAAARQYDGTGPSTSLTDRIKAFYGIEQIHELKRRIGLDNVSKLTHLVGEEAEAGDAVANAIMQETARDLAGLTSGVLQRMGGALYQVALAGGLWGLGKLLLEPFKEEMGRVHPETPIIPAAFPPVVGALLIALQVEGLPWTEERINTIGATITGERMQPHV